MVAMSVGQQEIAQPPAGLERRVKILDQQFGLHSGARIDERAFPNAVKQVDVTVEIMRKREFAACY